MSMTENVCNLLDNLTKHNSRAFGYELSQNEILQILKLFDDVKELKQYRAIGTVKEIKIREAQFERLSKSYLNNLTLLREYQAIGTVEELQEAKIQYDNINSAAQSITLGGVSDFETAKESVISTIKALKGKDISKKVVAISLTHEGRVGNCPNCNTFVLERKDKNCPKCRRELDWCK